MLKTFTNKLKSFKFLNESFSIIGKDSSKLPKMLILFFLISIFELIGIGLIGPYILIISDPKKILDFLMDYDRFFHLELTSNELIVWLSVILVIIFVFKSLLTILTNYIILKFSNDQRVKIQTKLMSNYQKIPYEKYIQRNSSDYIQSIQMLADRFSSGVLLSGIRVVNEGLVVIVILSFLAWNSFDSFIIITTLVGFFMFIYDLIFRKKMLNLGFRSIEEQNSMLQGLNEGIEGLKEIRILGTEEYFLKKVKFGAKGYGDCFVYSSTVSTSPRYFLEILMMFFVVTLVLIEIYFYGEAVNILPTLGVFGVAALRLLPSVNLISNSISNFRYSRDSISRLYKDLNIIDNLKSLENNSVGNVDFKSIETSKLFFKYDGATKNTLRNVNIQINKGESVGIIGSSGSGKTTLLDSLLGLLEPSKGSILFNGESIHSQLSSWRDHIAYLPQQIFIIDDSLRNNIALGISSNQIDDLKVMDAIRKASLHDLYDQLPLGLDTILGERGVRISGGQRQRVALARAFYHDRDVLFMDESTSALDTETEEEIMREILYLKGKKTLIVIAHRLNTLRHCDRIYKLKDGTIEDIGVLDKNSNFKSLN